MSMQRFVTGGVEALGDREVGVVASTDQLARDGHILEPSGIQLGNYQKNPIVLWSHDVDQPVGAATALAVEARSLCARIQFAPQGVSDKADEICSLVKAGIVRGISIGFDPIDAEPIDARNPRGGLHITAADLLEISFVAVGADTGAGVVARSFSARPGAAAMLRGLPAVSRRAVEHAMSQVGRARVSQVPIMSLSDSERTALYAQAQRQRTMATWAIGYANDVEQRTRYSLEQRQADLRLLSPESTH